MPRQPLSTFRQVRHVDIRLEWGAASPFRQREALALLCMEAIGSWSHVEAAMLRLFIALLGNSRADAARMYLALDGRSPKTAAITAVAASRLAGEHLKIFGGILAAGKARQKERDDLAHGIWGISNELPDALLWVEAKHLPLDFHPRGMADFLNNAARYSKKICVYREQDFRDIATNNGNLSRAVSAFNYLVVYPDTDRSNPICDPLYSVPEIASRVRRPA